MAKGIVKKKEKKFRDMYQEYLSYMKRGGKNVHKKAKTQSEWRKLEPRTRQIELGKARSN